MAKLICLCSAECVEIGTPNLEQSHIWTIEFAYRFPVRQIKLGGPLLSMTEHMEEDVAKPRIGRGRSPSVWGFA